MYIESTNIDKITSEIKNVAPKKDQLVCILIGEKNAPDLNELVDSINTLNINFCGGIFPGLIYGSSFYEEGVIIKILPNVYDVRIIKNLHTADIIIPKVDLIKNKEYCAFILVDGLTSNISLFLSELYNRYGNTVSYLGGGAGSLNLKQQAFLISNEGVFQDAAIVVFSELRVSLGVKHGWEKIHGPLIATQTNKNVINQLNWENAYEVYKAIVEEHSAENFESDNFFEISKNFPFGISKDYSECIIRDPIALNENEEIICVGEIPENTVLELLKGNKTLLINAAKEAAIESSEVDTEPFDCLIIDCVSRALFLKESFQDELKEVANIITKNNHKLIPSGALTLGEISSYGYGFLEFFNKTIVIGLLYE